MKRSLAIARSIAAVAAAALAACGNSGNGAADKPPVVRILAPADGARVDAGAQIELRGEANDPEQGMLSGEALRWTSSLQGALGKGTSIQVALLPGLHRISLRASDASGNEGAQEISVAAAAKPNTAPSAAIAKPLAGAQIDEGQPLVLEGSATDAQDGPLAGAALAWTSSRDGALGTGAKLTVARPSRGTHRIVLAATDKQGLTGYASVEVSVVPVGSNHAPAAVIETPAPNEVFAPGAPVALLGAGSDAEDAESALAFAWSSSLDGALGTGKQLTVTTLKRGAHVLTLTVTDTQGAKGTATVAISVASAGNQPPAAQIAAPADGTAVFAGTPVELRGSATDAEDGAIPAGKLAWTSSLDGALGTGASLTVDTLKVGAHRIRLVATDSKGDQGVAEIGLTVLAANQAPSVRIDSPADGTDVVAGTLVQLRGAATDPEDGPLTGARLTWRSSLDGVLGTGASVDTASLRAGSHQITLTASDSGARTASASVSLTVRPAQANLPPIARLSGPAQAAIGEMLSFDGSASSDADGTIAQFRFDFGDGTQAVQGGSPTATHAFAAEGTYTVALVVTDEKGATGSASVTVTVTKVPRLPGVVDERTTGDVGCVLALDGANRPRVVWRDGRHRSLWFAYWTGSTWQLEQVDGPGYEAGGLVSELAFALGAGGAPHVAYTLRDAVNGALSLHYATRAAGAWSREAVAAGVYGGAVALVLDPARSARPTIAYGASYSNIGLAYRTDAASWTTEARSFPLTYGSGATFAGGLAAIGGDLALTYRGSSAYLHVGRVTPGSTAHGLYLGYASTDALTPLLSEGTDRLLAAAHGTAWVVAQSGALEDAAASSWPFEASADADANALALGAGRLWIAERHAGDLEIAHAPLLAHWDRFSLGPADAMRPSIAVGSDGELRACFFRGGKLLVY